MAKYIVIERNDMEEMIIFPEFLKHSTMKNRLLWEDGDNSHQDKAISAGTVKQHSTGTYCLMKSVSLGIDFNKDREQRDNLLLDKLFESFIP